MLFALYNVNYLQLPFQLIKRERPDFEMVNGCRKIGIEATEIINPDYARLQTLLEVQNSESVLDPSNFKWSNQGRSLASLRKEASKTKLTGPAWVGDSVEREFAQSVIDTINTKHEKLINGFHRFAADFLLIYHNHSTPVLDFDAAIRYTDERLKEYWSKGGGATW
jgi:CxxC motif-containing protein